MPSRIETKIIKDTEYRKCVDCNKWIPVRYATNGNINCRCSSCSTVKRRTYYGNDQSYRKRKKRKRLASIGQNLKTPQAHNGCKYKNLLAAIALQALSDIRRGTVNQMNDALYWFADDDMIPLFQWLDINPMIARQFAFDEYRLRVEG